MRPVISYVAVMVVLCTVPLAAQQAQDPADAGAQTEEQAAAGDQPDPEAQSIEADQYTGVWTLPQGPLRLEWNLEADQYEFYVYEGESVRIGSRGPLEVDGRELTFTAEEITEDGDEWQPVQVEDESRTSRTFHATVQDQSLLLASPEATQFYIQYYRPDAVPGGTEAGDNGESENGEDVGAGGTNGTQNTQAGGLAEPGAAGGPDG